MKILIFTILFNILNYTGGITYTESAQRIFAQMAANGSEPNAERKTIINQLVKDLQGNGNHGSFNVWALYDILQVYAAANEPQALTEWIIKDNPGDYDPIKINNPIFTSNFGYTGVVRTSCLDDNFNAAINGSNFSTSNNNIGGFFICNTVAGYTAGYVNNPYFYMRMSETITDQTNNSISFPRGKYNLSYGIENFFYNDRSNISNFDLIKGETVQNTLTATRSATFPNNTMGVLGLKRPDFSFYQQTNNTCKIWHRAASLKLYLNQVNGAYNDYLNAI